MRILSPQSGPFRTWCNRAANPSPREGGCAGIGVCWRLPSLAGGATGRLAFSLVEVLVAVTVIALSGVGFYYGFSTGFGVVQVSRENLRGTQILQEKMETIRLYSWDQINTTNFIPSTFVEPFYSVTQAVSGLMYTGSVQITAAPISEPYSNEMRQVAMEVHWLSGKTPRSREMKTMISRYGLQNYIY